MKNLLTALFLFVLPVNTAFASQEWGLGNASTSQETWVLLEHDTFLRSYIRTDNIQPIGNNQVLVTHKTILNHASPMSDGIKYDTLTNQIEYDCTNNLMIILDMKFYYKSNIVVNETTTDQDARISKINKGTLADKDLVWLKQHNYCK